MSRAEISKTVPPGIVMVNVGHWHVDNGGSTVDSVTVDDHCGFGIAEVYSDTVVEVVKLDQAS